MPRRVLDRQTSVHNYMAYAWQNIDALDAESNNQLCTTRRKTFIWLLLDAADQVPFGASIQEAAQIMSEYVAGVRE